VAGRPTSSYVKRAFVPDDVEVAGLPRTSRRDTDLTTARIRPQRRLDGGLNIVSRLDGRCRLLSLVALFDYY
jgi:hypothetical protein